VTGLVQGVGFRPFVYRTAMSYGLRGWVRNTNKCVEILLQGDEEAVRRLLNDIREHPPRASRVEEIEARIIPSEKLDGFGILESRNTSDEITDISPDIAVCSDCLEDLKLQPRRKDYPFINCTNCGPRFTIINDLPYDRKNTSMKEFVMCSQCSEEYHDPDDRRFHAQPIACSVCGPHYTLVSGKKQTDDTDEQIRMIREIFESGGIMAMKGLGGFHLACDATNEMAVARLKQIKEREGKPFAVMFPSVEILKQYAVVSPEEEKTLTSWRRPIVLLDQGKNKKLPHAVCAGLNTTGAMLPYLPFHHLLLKKFKRPVILTSGNLLDEPILTSNKKAIGTFSGTCDAVLVYNREIENRTDDSVVRVIRNIPRVMRRSRGFVPEPVDMGINVDGIFATGGDLVNTFCIGKGRKAYLSQYIGNLGNTETTDFYEEMAGKFRRIFRTEPEIVVSDLHPDYFTTRFAENFPGAHEHIRVQHHHAHIASCMAENGLNEPVIGVAFDGTGYGTDGNIWGGEFLFCDLKDFERFTHFDYVPLPGGDRGVEEPWRMAVSWLNRIYKHPSDFPKLPLLEKIDPEKTGVVIRMLESKINSPLVSSTGRLFDAVSALMSLCLVATFPAEGPMRLESIIQPGCRDQYPFSVNGTIFFDDTIRGIVEDILSGEDHGKISAKFHNTIIAAVCEVAEKMKTRYHCKKIVLSGGTFQNKYLVENVVKMLTEFGYSVFSPKNIPANDGGLSLGQLAIAAKRRNLSCV
jgi:hydrogenase maturation protein HypF